MYLTINNPCACMDSLTGLNDKQYLLRRMNELTDAHKAFHIITVYAYQLDHMNKSRAYRAATNFCAARQSTCRRSRAGTCSA